jgi:hypothetical protein
MLVQRVELGGGNPLDAEMLAKDLHEHALDAVRPELIHDQHCMAGSECKSVVKQVVTASGMSSERCIIDRHETHAAFLQCRTSGFGSAESQACLQQAFNDVLVVDAVCVFGSIE